MVCDVGQGKFKDFPTYQAAWESSAKTCDASAGGGGQQHGKQLTDTEKKALTTAYGADYKPASLSSLFGICGGIDAFYVTKIINTTQANEATGALMICPDHPNAKKIQANIDKFDSPPPADGSIYYSMVCDVGGDFQDFPTYKAAWAGKADSCDASSGGGGEKHGQRLTDTQKKALTTAYGPGYDPESLSSLFGLCGGINDFYVTKIINTTQANEATGALMICPDHPNAKKIRANIDAVDPSTPGPAPDPTAAPNPSDEITYEVTGSAGSALVTYTKSGGSIGQENGVPVPWSKTLTISDEYRVLSVSAQNSGDGDITCTIKVGGKVVETVTSKGAYAIASCTSS